MRLTGPRSTPAGMIARLRPALFSLLAFPSTIGLQAPLFAQDAAAFFRANCYSCHSIGGGRITGPDLRNATDRKERRWLVNFIQNPKDVIDGGDPYALQLVKEARGVIMPRVPGVTPAMAQALLDLIEKEGALEESNFMGLQVSDRPILPEEVSLGLSLFTGRKRLQNRGPACVSCHSTEGLPGLGGGRIGPDLSKAFERLGGRRALSSWLLSPATPTMSSIFRSRPLVEADITALAALLEDRAKSGSESEPTAQRAGILFLSLLGAAFGFALADRIWRRRP